MDGYEKRINDLRAAGVVERLYKGVTPFEGATLHLAGSLGRGVDELSAKPELHLSATLYGGAFEFLVNSYVLIKKEGIMNVIDSELGEGASNHIPLREMGDHENIEARLIRKPGTDLTHVFFMPSQAYMAELRKKFSK